MTIIYDKMESFQYSFIGGAYANGNIGIYLTAGLNLQNTFISPIIENVSTGIFVNSSLTKNNLFLMPFFDIWNPLTSTGNGYCLRGTSAGNEKAIIADSSYLWERTGWDRGILHPTEQTGITQR